MALVRGVFFLKNLADRSRAIFVTLGIRGDTLRETHRGGQRLRKIDHIRIIRGELWLTMGTYISHGDSLLRGFLAIAAPHAPGNGSRLLAEPMEWQHHLDEFRL